MTLTPLEIDRRLMELTGTLLRRSWTEAEQQEQETLRSIRRSRLVNLPSVRSALHKIKKHPTCS